MSFVDARGPGRSFTLAVLGSALTAATILTAAFVADVTEVEPEGLPILFIVALIASAIVIAVAAALIGLPLTWLLDRTGSEEAWTYPAAGLACGGAMFIAFYRLLEGARPVPEMIVKIAPLGAVPGFVCGTLWWFLHRRHVSGPGTGR